MIDLARVMQNLLTIAILFGFGYIVYMNLRGKKITDFREKFRRFGGFKK